MANEPTTTNGQAAAMVPANITPDQALARAKETSGSIAAFSSTGNFEAAQRMAKALAASNMVPEGYRGNISNVLIAMELASRVGASVFAVMQNLYIVKGNPGWSSKFLIATVNASGKFTPLRFRFEGTENTPGWSCRAVAKSLEDNEECVGPKVSLQMARDENWGPKWKTLPELMLMYRAAAFWTRVFCPELSLGMQTHEEVIDVQGYTVEHAPAGAAPGDLRALETQILGPAAPPVVEAPPPSEPKVIDANTKLVEKAVETPAPIMTGPDSDGGKPAAEPKETRRTRASKPQEPPPSEKPSDDALPGLDPAPNQGDW